MARLGLLLAAMTLVVNGLLNLIVPVTFAQFSATRVSATHIFSGAVFSPKTAPAVSAVINKGSARLTWSEVTISSGVSVTYVVVRIASNGSQTTICTGRNLPTISSGQVLCIDDKPGSNPTYTEQPIVLVGSQITWSLAPSIAN